MRCGGGGADRDAADRDGARDCAGDGGRRADEWRARVRYRINDRGERYCDAADELRAWLQQRIDDCGKCHRDAADERRACAKIDADAMGELNDGDRAHKRRRTDR